MQLDGGSPPRAQPSWNGSKGDASEVKELTPASDTPAA